MATKKVKSKEKVLDFVQIANELNEVMQYGVDPETGEVDTSQQIDTELEEEALFDEIIKSAKEDLAANDEESFSPEVWAWFLAHGVVPAGMEEEEPEDEDDPNDLGEGSQEEEEEEVEPAKPVNKKASKEVKKEEKPAPKAKEEKKIKKQPAVREKKERGPSNEVIAKEMYEAGKTIEDFIKKFTEIYLERGKDKEFGEQRGRDYYGFAMRALGVKPEKTKIKKKAPVVKEKVEKIKEKTKVVESKPEKKLAKKIKK